MKGIMADAMSGLDDIGGSFDFLPEMTLGAVAGKKKASASLTAGRVAKKPLVAKRTMVTKPRVQTAQVAPASVATEPVEQSHWQKYKWYYIAGGGVALASAVGVGAYFYLKKKKGKK